MVYKHLSCCTRLKTILFNYILICTEKKGQKELRENASNDHASAILTDFPPFLSVFQVSYNVV